MVLIIGQTLCGRVDEVPGFCYVATRFLHLYYVPLIPLSSWLIVEGTEKSPDFQGQQIPLSFKSVICGWLQTFLVLFGLYQSIVGGFLLADQQRAANNGGNGTLKFGLGLMCLFVWALFAIRPMRAGQQRADELLARLGITPETIDETFN